MAYTTWEVESERLEVQGLPWLHEILKKRFFFFLLYPFIWKKITEDTLKTSVTLWAEETDYQQSAYHTSVGT